MYTLYGLMEYYLPIEIRFFWRGLFRPLPRMSGWLQEHMSPVDKCKDRFYSFALFKLPGIKIKAWGAGKLGGLHGKYNWPPADKE